jgi:hypothetical protein
MKYAKLAIIIVLVATTGLVSFRAGEAQTALQVCVDAPAAQRARILTGFTNAYAYQPTIEQPDGTTVQNPQTRAQFFKHKLAEFVRETVKSYEAGQAAEAARLAAAQSVDSETGIQ